MKISPSILRAIILIACLVGCVLDRENASDYAFWGILVAYYLQKYEFYLYKKKFPEKTTKTIESRLYHCAKARFQKR